MTEVCLLTQKQMKRHQEVPTREQGIAFDKAKDEEIGQYLSTGSVKQVRISDVPKSERIIPMRFVCTWKENAEGIRIKAKARLVARGDLDRRKDELAWNKTSARTPSRISSRLFFWTVAQMMNHPQKDRRWKHAKWDVKTAFLHSNRHKPYERDIYLKY